MARSNQTLQALTRALIAIAWKDGELTDEERNVLKDVTFLMPEMTAADWRDLEMYWLTSIGNDERRELMGQLRQALQSNDSKAYAYNVFEAMVYLDGEVTDAEKNAIREVGTALEQMDGNLEPAMAHLLDSVLEERSGKRAKQLAHKPDPGDFVRNRVYHALRQRFGQNMEERIGLDDYELRRLGLAGAVMARIAYADQQIDDKEVQAIQRVLEREWSLSSDHAAIVTDSALEATRYALDDYRVLREFYEVTLEFERIDFLNVLFRIAYAAQGLTVEEAAEIERVAEILKIRPDEYQQAFQHAKRTLAR